MKCHKTVTKRIPGKRKELFPVEYTTTFAVCRNGYTIEVSKNGQITKCIKTVVEHIPAKRKVLRPVKKTTQLAVRRDAVTRQISVKTVGKYRSVIKQYHSRQSTFR